MKDFYKIKHVQPPTEDAVNREYLDNNSLSSSKKIKT